MARGVEAVSFVFRDGKRSDFPTVRRKSNKPMVLAVGDMKGSVTIDDS